MRKAEIGAGLPSAMLNSVSPVRTNVSPVSFTVTAPHAPVLPIKRPYEIVPCRVPGFRLAPCDFQQLLGGHHFSSYFLCLSESQTRHALCYFPQGYKGTCHSDSFPGVSCNVFVISSSLSQFLPPMTTVVL